MLVPEAKIIVCCSQGVSGGPELLHQLVHELRANGRDAYICYYPFDIAFSCPEAYKKYDVRQTALIDEADTFILVPESATWILKLVNKARGGVWWLSVDNYFLAKGKSRLEDLYLRYKSLVRTRLPISQLRRLIHFSQSHYAEKFLTERNIQSYPLTDYLASDHLVDRIQSSGCHKENIVVFNPLKGRKKTQLLVDKYPNIEFVPIQKMTAHEVASLLTRAKIYIDFGHHPGKDRPPREAAMAGCCVLTGRGGSAAYYEDVPISEKYKLNDTTENFVDEFGKLAKEIFENFSVHTKDFDTYRVSILEEPGIFKAQVKQIFG